ncbi:Extracellular protease, partial [Candidatus Magnetomorum sp. HK-1]
MKKIITIKYVFIVLLINCAVPGITFGEQCVEGVRKLIPWASDWHGHPYEWRTKGQNYGLNVNQSASGCSSSDPCILVYPRDYGSGISEEYGHVAVLKSSSSPYNIQDSNGVCGGGDRASCKKSVRLNDAYVIHPPLTLTSGSSISNSVDKNKWKQYKIKASSSYSKVEIELAPENGDPDLYVRKGSMPTTSDKDCRPYKGGRR